MKWLAVLSVALSGAGLLEASPVVDKLDREAMRQAHQRDNTATRAKTGVRIATADGRLCLSVDRLSGDSRANMTPVQLESCRKTRRRQRWDVITSGIHNNQPGQALIVSAATQACLNVDRREPMDQRVFLYSCGGRADGSGTVTDSQLFAYQDGVGPRKFRPQNSVGWCLTAGAETLGIQPCNKNGTATQEARQRFIFLHE
ncbi:hypothetical protein XA68_13322 [Ophiocordyceps unilateralis]|uniref:Uncharacterized protein n=1 Tax=Ophiocordyceps unilateralis TaxID=268505 RepID=A0A2A9PD08_OPHUN|nr:hypothetical protein XA68_13322 [Ophiocordyceps unilateralis]